MTIFSKIFRAGLDHYKSIADLPLWNWNKINETDNLSYLLYSQRKISVNEQEYLKQIFEVMYSEFINTFGINDVLRRVMELKRDISVLQLEMAIHGDFSRQTFIDIKTDELKKIIEDSEKQTNSTLKAYIDKYMGFFIDDKKISVKDYYSYIELLKEEAKASEKHGRQN